MSYIDRHHFISRFKNFLGRRSQERLKPQFLQNCFSQSASIFTKKSNYHVCEKRWSVSTRLQGLRINSCTYLFDLPQVHSEKHANRIPETVNLGHENTTGKMVHQYNKHKTRQETKITYHFSFIFHLIGIHFTTFGQRMLLSYLNKGILKGVGERTGEVETLVQVWIRIYSLLCSPLLSPPSTNHQSWKQHRHWIPYGGCLSNKIITIKFSH